MAENRADIVFQRGQEEDDAWDDSALIKAYDKAVNLMKKHIAERNGEGAELEISEPSPGQVPKGNKKKKKKRRKPQNRAKSASNPLATQQQWKVGSLCRAVYTEDGAVYEARIKFVDQVAGTCMVQYLGYGNEEEHSLSDLLPSALQTGSVATTPDLMSESDSMEWQSHTSPRPASRGSNYRRSSIGRGSGIGGASGYPWPPPPPQGLPPFPGMMPQPPLAMPPAFPMVPPMFPSWGSAPYSNPPKMPKVPPPPPVNEEEVQNDSEALYSMLIAWYMSGYHTGYYQGMKQGRKVTKPPSQTPATDVGNEPPTTTDR